MALWVLGLPDDRRAAVEVVERTDAGLVKDDRVLLQLTRSQREHEDLIRDPETWTRYLIHLLPGTTDSAMGARPLPARDHRSTPASSPEALLADLVEEAMRLGCTDAVDW